MENQIIKPRVTRGNGMIQIFAIGIVGLLVVLAFAKFATPAAYPAYVAQAPTTGSGVAPVGAVGAVQDIYVTALPTGSYDNTYIRVNANQPVRLHFKAASGSGCGAALIMRDFGVTLVSRGEQEQVAEFTPKPGKYEYSCSMRMFRGTLEAV